MISATPPREDTGTTRPERSCAGCGQRFLPIGRALHCSSAGRKRVFRARHGGAAAVEQTGTPPKGTRREHTVYQCPDCGDRQLGVQRCENCGLFGRALGLGGACPGCGDPVTLNDLDLESKALR